MGKTEFPHPISEPSHPHQTFFPFFVGPFPPSTNIQNEQHSAEHHMVHSQFLSVLSPRHLAEGVFFTCWPSSRDVGEEIYFVSSTVKSW